GCRTSATSTARRLRSPRSSASCAPTSPRGAETYRGATASPSFATAHHPHHCAEGEPRPIAPNDPVHMRGPVLVRREKGGGHTTTDQRLLDKNQDTDWLHTDPWRVLRIQSEFVNGFGALAELSDAVSVFGSARTRPGDP